MKIVTLTMYPPCPWAIPVIKSGVNVKIYSCHFPKNSKGAEALVELKKLRKPTKHNLSNI